MGRYQAGTITRLKTKAGPVYYIRFRNEDGVAPRIRLGFVKDLPTKAALERAASEVRKSFNEHPEVVLVRTFDDVIARYMREEMPLRYSTASTYKCMLRKHIQPRWGAHAIADIKAASLREWLTALPLSTRSRGHIRDLMRVLFRFAMLWEWAPATVNPVTLFQVMGSTKRRAKPRVLTSEELTRLMAELTTDPVRTMALVAACWGLRSSEIGGLRWGDFDWIGAEVHVRRGIVHGRVGEVKTEASQKGLPLHPDLARHLMAYRSRSIYKEPEDYVFASPHCDGKKPYAMHMLQMRVLKPVGVKLGLGPIGWHTFRHTYRASLGTNGESMEVQQKLMRHSDIRTTMNVYGDSYSEALREANAKVVKVVMQ